ncbi:HD-GYP domain-containing protein [Candidatus Riflebacteria bacterium]
MNDELEKNVNEILLNVGKELVQLFNQNKLTHSMAKEDWENAILSVATAFSSVIEARDKNSFGRSKKVAFCSNKIGCYLHLSRDKLINLKIISYLHNIGNVAIPDSILFKKGPLNQVEFNTMKIHPLLSARLAAELPFVGREVVESIKHHHEKYDGTGYPDGLSGEDIPLLARILTLADSVVAMLSRRYYGEKYVFYQVLDEVKKNSRRHFDPMLAEHIEEIFPTDPLQHFIANRGS